MIIGIDGNEANTINRVGSNVYAFELLTAMENLTKNSADSIIVFLNSPPIGDLPKPRKGWQYQILKPSVLSTQWALPIALFKLKNKLDVFYTPGHYAPRYCPIPYASSVMDLAFLRYPKQFRKRDYFQLRSWTKYSVKNAHHIITISEASKIDIMDAYGILPDKITVAYPALPTPSVAIADKIKQKILTKFNITSPFVLYVGTIQPRKNLVNLIEAFEQLMDDHSKKYSFKPFRFPLSRKDFESPLQLVIAGKIGWLAGDVLRKVERSKYSASIILTDFITDQEKEVLYQSAEVLALVGLYEGFGMPPLEALQHNLPVVVSNCSSLPEAVGEAGILVQPQKVKSIKRGLKKALALTPKQRKDFEKKAQEQVQKFSWAESARKVLKVMKKVAN